MTSINDNELNEVLGGITIPYLVKQGDTVKSLAKKFKCTEEQLCEWNNIEDPNFIMVGQKLIFKF